MSGVRSECEMGAPGLVAAGAEGVAPKSRVRPKGFVAVLALLSGFGPFATDMYLSGLEGVGNSFSASPAQVAQTISVFFAGLAIGPLLHGPLSDRFGRRTPLLAGVAVFMIASALIAMSWSIEMMIGLRFLQAVGGAAGMIVGRAMVADLFDEWEIARFMSLLMTITIFVPLIAPTVGGWMIVHLGWRSVFVFAAGFGALCFVASWRLLGETLPVERRVRARPRDIAAGYLRLARRRDFMAPTLTAAFMQAAMFCFITGSPFVFMKLHQVSESRYGLLFAMVAIGFGVSAQINRFLLRRRMPRQILRIGVPLNVAAALALLLTTPFASLPVLIGLLFLCTCTLGLIGPNAAATAMAHTGRDAGSGSALIGCAQFSVAAFASMLTGMLQNDTAWPMTAMIAVCSVTGAVVYLIFFRTAD